MPKHGLPLGIDVGGSGIKGAPVDLEEGDFAHDRLRIPTPEHATPEAVADVIATIVDHFEDVRGDSPIGITVPAVVTRGITRSAANIDDSWIDVDAQKLLQKRLGHPVVVVNDADAAGVAEMRFGAARHTEGLVVLATLGTGIGSALILDGELIPNSELGHLEINGHDAETQAADSAREREGLGWSEWAARLQTYFRHVEDLLWPDLFVVGGGVSKHSAQFLPLLDLRTPIVPAELLNKAGIIGAAVLAERADRRRKKKGKKGKKGS